MDVARLLEVADQFRHLVRDEDPAANLAWLRAQLPDPDDRERVAFVLAAMVPDQSARRLLAWTDPKPDPTFVDEIAVERACRGEKMRLNRAETDAAIDRLNRRGLGSRVIAERLGVSARTVLRRRVASRQPVVQSHPDAGMAS